MRQEERVDEQRQFDEDRKLPSNLKGSKERLEALLLEKNGPSKEPLG